MPPTGDYDVGINIHDVYQLATTPVRKPDPRSKTLGRQSRSTAIHTYACAAHYRLFGDFFG